MPVSRMKMGKGSNHAIEREALDDARILININVVIEIDEIVPECLPKDQPDDAIKPRQTKKDANVKEVRFLRCLAWVASLAELPRIEGSFLVLALSLR